MIISSGKSLIHSGVMLPYSSSWLVFANLLKWNRFYDIRQLVEYFLLSSQWREHSVHWEYSKNFPMTELETAMSLEVGTLKSSFIDWWFPDMEHSHRAQIRHCPQCIKAGYHSVIFYFERVTHCPWHGHALELCEKCTRLLNVDFTSQQAMYRFGGQCDHLSVVLGLTRPQNLDAGFFYEVDQWVTDFADWIRGSINLIGRSAHEVLVNTLKSEMMDVSIAYGYLVRNLGSPGFANDAFNNSVVLTLPCPKLRSNSENGVSRNLGLPAIMGGLSEHERHEMRTCVKSLRRYIFKRYIRHHRKCLMRLRRIEHDQWYMLRADVACPCVMAYLLVVAKNWGVTPFDFIHTRKRLRLNSVGDARGKEASQIHGEFEAELVMKLGDFYRLWDTLRNSHLVDAECVLCLDRHFRGVWGFTPESYQTGSIWGVSTDCDRHLFMEDPDSLISKEKGNCRMRLSLPLTIEADTARKRFHIKKDNISCALFNSGMKRGGTHDIEI